MSATLFLVRHGTHDLIGRALAGRTPAVHLNAEGRRQADALAERFAGETVSCVFSSPLERAWQTAQPIAARLGLGPERVAALADVDYGAWNGRTFEELDREPAWAEWKQAPATYRPPGGETFADVSRRTAAFLDEMLRASPEARAVLVTHCDVIRAILSARLGIAADEAARMEVAPASVTKLEIDAGGARLAS